KFGKVRPAKMGGLEQFNAIACDRRPECRLAAQAKQHGIALLAD
nr:DNA-binding transcriptional repressor DeoR [Pluralibacter gergoviae]